MTGLVVEENVQDACRAVSQRITQLVTATQGEFHMGISGGSTPEILYSLWGAFASDSPEWMRVHIWWCDERYVPYSDPRSNYGKANALWLQQGPGRFAGIHPIPFLSTCAASAVRYQEELECVCGSRGLDLVLLGVGPDGHIASLFPEPQEFWKGDRCIACHHPSDGTDRISLSYTELLRSRAMLFLVTGSSKAPVLAKIFRGEPLPASRCVQDHGDATWFLDRSALPNLSQETHYA